MTRGAVARATALAGLSLVVALAAAGRARAQTAARPVIVASKPFGESYLLAELFAQLLEARGYSVDRRLGLGATELAFGALESGAIDVYPEYTGTGLLAILHDSTVSDPRAVYARVATEFRRRWGMRWLPPLGFENTYAIAVRPETARRYHLRTLTDLVRAGPALVAGFTPDFIGRPDGLPGLRRAYGLELRAVRPLVPAVKYQALAAGNVDVIDGYSTDGFIARYDLVVLQDDRHFFPPYYAAALAGERIAREEPGALLALTELSGRLSDSAMRRFNEQVEVEGRPVAAVAANALAQLGLVAPRAGRAGARAGAAKRSTPAGARSGQRERGSLLSYLADRRALLARLTLRHLLLVALSLGAAVLVAVPAGLALERAAGAAETAIRAAGVLQTIPSIALLAFMLPLLGIGVVPALVALFLYSLYPILRNTYTGVRAADPDAVRASHALGMTPGQTLRYVRLPLAAPVILAGIRTAAVLDVGTATLAAFIGAGGLGDPIVAGLSLNDTRMVLSGAIPAALLALVVDGALGWCERLVAPRG